MEWNDEYAIGIELIDHQHQELFRAVNRVKSILDQGDVTRNQRICIEALRFLKNYTLTHFREEEAYQQSIHYANFEQHKKFHAAFCAIISDYDRKFQECSFTHESISEFINVLQYWLINHILFQDQLIAKSLQK